MGFDAKSCAVLTCTDKQSSDIAQGVDEGTGTVDSLDEALSIATGTSSPVDRETEARLYRDIVCQQFEDPEMILQHAGTWAEDRVDVRN